MTKSKLLII